MRIAFAALAAGTLWVVSSAAAQTPAASRAATDVAALEWLAGSWGEERAGGWTEELWMKPRGGIMLGVNRSGTAGRTSGFEYMRIAVDPAGRIGFWASPSGGAAVPFRLVSSGPREAVFENPGNDYPTRIAYRRTGATLTATISGPDGAKPMSWTFRRR
jgi:hypothetical protein